MKLIQAIGYRVVYQKVLDAGDTSPMHRQRWIAIACDTLSLQPFDFERISTKMVRGTCYQTPLSFGCMISLTEDQKANMRLPENIMKKYFDR